MNGHAITVPGGPLECGYCGQEERFPHVRNAGGPQVIPAAELAKGTISLTGDVALGVSPDGELVVLVEVRTWSGRPGWLVHFCPAIPDAEREEYAEDIEEIKAGKRSP